MNGFICMMMLLAGFPRGDTTDYTILLDYIDADITEVESLTEGTWFALFEADSAYELRKVELLLIPDESTVDEWERPPGVMLEILDESESPLFFVRSSEPVFTEGPVSTALHDYQHLNPDTSITLNTQGVQETRLFTTEDGLFLSDDEICQHVTDTSPGLLYSANFISVVWAGDIDRDGIIDLLIDDVNDGYDRYEYKLYLSSEAEPGSIVEMVASFYDVYY